MSASHPSQAYYYWTNTGYPSYTNDGDKLKMENNESSAVPTAYITCDNYIFQADSISFRMVYQAAYTGGPTYNHIYLMFKYGSNYLDNTPSWGTSPAYYVIDINDTSEHDITIDFPPDIAAANSFSPGTTLEIRLYEYYNENVNPGSPPASWTNYLLVSSMFLDVQTSDPVYKIHTYENTADISFIKEVPMALGDSVQFSPAYDDEAFVNTYATGRGSLTQDWSIIGDPTASATIGEVLARQTVEGFRKNLDIFRGTIRSTDYDMGAPAFEDPNLVDEYGFEKRYLPKGHSYDARKCEYSGEWIECPATYTDESIDWASSTYDTYTITANEIEVDSSPGIGTATSDPYVAVAGETIRVVLVLVDDGSSDRPACRIDGVAQSVVWGTNYLTYTFATAGSKTIVMGNETGETHNYTATITVYSLTGV
jgi:hypothetical protein